MRRIRTVALASLALTSFALTAGCGGSGSTPVTLISPGVPAVRTASSPPIATGSSGSTSQNPDATVGFVFSTGDRVELTFHIDKPTDMAAADPMAQSCRLNGEESRALVQHVVFSAKLTSSLGGKFGIDFGKPMLVPLAIQLASGGQCLSPWSGTELTLSLTPGQSTSFNVWMLGDNAITPAYPAGDPTILSEMMFEPSMHVAAQSDGVIEYAFGSRVLVCRLENVHNIQTEIFGDPAAFAKGDSGCAPAATRAAFAALEKQAGTVGVGGTVSP